MTTDDLLALLTEHATEDPATGCWHFGSHFPHSKDDALRIVEACVTLGVPISDTLTSNAWLALVRRSAELEHRVTALENWVVS